MLRDLLKAYKVERNVTYRQLAKEIGVEYPMLWRFLNGSDINSSQYLKILHWVIIGELKR